MEEKERNDRPQEIPQHTQPTEAHISTSSRPLDIVSRSVGPFCLRRRVEAQAAQGIYRFTSIYYIKHSMKISYVSFNNIFLIFCRIFQIPQNLKPAQSRVQLLE